MPSPELTAETLAERFCTLMPADDSSDRSAIAGAFGEEAKVT